MARALGRVLVAMSGGVDSSVAAALLKLAGYDVVGVAMRLWSAPGSQSGCCSLDDFADARRVAALMGFPFYVLDFAREFETSVLEPFVAEYLRGRTPNPCARCNQFVKFDALFQRAQALGASFVATGHYARVRQSATGEPQLWAASDAAKDQSYYLFGIAPERLPQLLFPVGELSKREVRAIAEQLGLPVAHKPESQEVCFAPRAGYAALVEQLAPDRVRPGVILDEESGTVVGAHPGVHRFTVGQRRGLGVSRGEPRYVVAIDPESGTVRVGTKPRTLAHGLRASGANWLVAQPPEAGTRALVKIRARSAPVPVLIEEASAEGFAVRADSPLSAVTPGQAAVLYEGPRVLGGGWIEESWG